MSRKAPFMNGNEVIDVARDAIWLAIGMSAPIMIVGLVVGIAIGLFQALTLPRWPTFRMWTAW